MSSAVSTGVGFGEGPLYAGAYGRRVCGPPVHSPDRVEASGNGGEIWGGPRTAADRATVHAAPRAPSSCTATLMRVPDIADGGATLAAPSCKRCVNVNPDRASGSLPGRCKRCVNVNPDCMFGSASALNLVV